MPCPWSLCLMSAADWGCSGQGFRRRGLRTLNRGLVAWGVGPIKQRPRDPRPPTPQLCPVARLGCFPKHRGAATGGLHLVALLELPALPPDLNSDSTKRGLRKKQRKPGARWEGLLFCLIVALGALFLALR